jgi:asparaginyl-tRNA synthetase
MTFPFARISELGRHVGQTVIVRGWVTHLRSSGKVAFVVLRDGSGLLQGVLVKNAVGLATWETFGQLTQETSLAVTGEVRADARAPGGYELGITELAIVGASPLDYPIQPKEHGVDFLMDRRHFWLRSPRQAALLRCGTRWSRRSRTSSTSARSSAATRRS